MQSKYIGKTIKCSHQIAWTIIKGNSKCWEVDCFHFFKNAFHPFEKVIDPEHLKELRKKVVDKCLKTSNSLFDEVEEFVGSSLPDQFQCIVDTLGDVSNNNGLADLWSKSQPQLQLHLDSWKRCANIENKVANLL